MRCRVIVCISGWDDTELLRGALESIDQFDWQTLYVDGAYTLYLDKPDDPWQTDAGALERAMAGHRVTIIQAHDDRPWLSEAEKKATAVRYAYAHPNALGHPTWALWLDTDERLEAGAGVELARAWLDRNLTPAHRWATLDCWRPDRGGTKQGSLPRLVRLGANVTFRPPMDFEVWDGEQQIALMDGEPVPQELAGAWINVPREVLSIRHERQLRDKRRTDMMGRYCVRRRALYGVG